MLNRDQLSSANRRKTGTVKVYDGEIMIRTMSGSQREEFLADLREAKSNDVEIPPGLQAKVACWTMINPDLSRMYQDDEIALVGDMDADDLEAILRASLLLSGLTETEDLSKNSEADLKDASGSDSPNLSVAQ